MRRERRAFFLSAVPQPPIELVDFAGVTPLGQTLRRTIKFYFSLGFPYQAVVFALSPTGIRSTTSSSATENPLSLT
jgi:hypothetical protein